MASDPAAKGASRTHLFKNKGKDADVSSLTFPFK